MNTEKKPVVLVTGATDGIGRETARALARKGAAVLPHGRSAEKLEAVRRELEAVAEGASLEPLRGDLGSLDEVRSMARALEARGDGVEVLLHNAGVYMNERRVSADGFEMTFAVNHLAPFLLTHLVLASPAGASVKRVVNVSSVAHSRGRLELDDLSFERRGFEPYAAYAASKLANVLFTVELARRLAPRGVEVFALHPGVVSTKLLTEGFGMRGSDSLEEGAATSVALALGEIGRGRSGGYFSALREAKPAPGARDAGLARRFYELSAELAGCEPLPEPAS